MHRRTGVRSVRRRTLVAWLTAGALGGAAFGLTILSGAETQAPGGPLPSVLHAAPAIVDAGADVRLGAATLCPQPDVDPCRITSAAAFVRPAGDSGWAQVQGQGDGGGFDFMVPAALVPPDGFAYWLRFTTAAGPEVLYPPGGDAAPLRVLTAAGLPSRRVPGAFSWDARQDAEGTALRLSFGDDDGQVGRTGGRLDEAVRGPSSFDVAPDGSIYLVDWVNRRIQVFSPNGRFLRAVPSPTDQPADIAIRPDGGMYLAELGMGATVYELDPSGRVEGRYPIGFGVSARVGATSAGPRVFVGPGQWVGVSLRAGVPLPAQHQSLTETSYMPLVDGGIGLAAPLGPERFAAVWTRTDGSRGGAIVQLPSGVRPGTDYFVRPTEDGGAVVAEGLWDDTHMGVGLFRFGPTGSISWFSLLPEPSTEQSARSSTVRLRSPGEVLVAFEDDRAVTIRRFEVG